VKLSLRLAISDRAPIQTGRYDNQKLEVISESRAIRPRNVHTFAYVVKPFNIVAEVRDE
jgi:hypothetical protein